MARFDTTSNAQLLLGGFDRGVDLSRGQLQGLLQTARFMNDVRQGQQLLGIREQENTLRQQAFEMERERYGRELMERLDQKDADRAVSSWLNTWDGVSPPPVEVGSAALRASRELRGSVFDAQGVSRELKRVNSQIEAARKNGTIQSASELRKRAYDLGITLQPADYPPTEREQVTAQAKRDMAFVVRDAVDAGLIEPSRGERFVSEAQSDNDVAYVKNLLKQQADAARVAQEAARQAVIDARVGSIANRLRSGQPVTDEERGIAARTLNEFEQSQPDADGGRRAAIASAKSALDVARQNLSAAAEYADSTEEDDGQARLASAQRDYDAAYARYQAVSAGGVPRGTQAPAQGGSMPPDLVEKARTLKAQGLTPDQIKKSLEADGWRFN